MIRSLLIGLLTAMVFPAFLSQAQEEAEPGREEPRPAVRAWLFPADATERVSLVLETGDGAGGSIPLVSTENGAVAASPVYEQSPLSKARLELKSGDKVLVSGGLALTEGRFYTAAAWREGSDWKVKVFLDGPPAGAGSPRPVRVFNFADGRTTMLEVGEAEHKVGAGSVFELQVAPKPTMITASVLAPDGSHPAISSVEIDLASAPSAYVVVGPDYRGRMRPRVIEGGPLPETDSPVEASGLEQVEGQY